MQIFSMFRGHINPPSSEAITQIHPSVTFEKISCELVVTGGNHYALEINQLYGNTDLELDLPLRVLLWSLENDSTIIWFLGFPRARPHAHSTHKAHMFPNPLIERDATL